MSAALKSKSCRACHEPFVPWRFAQVACSPKCALVVAEDNTRRKLAHAKRQGRLAMRTRRDYVKIASAAFNTFIRERDKALPCISCGRLYVEQTVGGSWDAGHYRTVGAAPQLRFDEANCHRQCKSCNAGGGRFAHKRESVDSRYRIELVRRIGESEVERLENDNTVRRHTVEELQEIARVYRARLRTTRKVVAA